MHKEKIKKSLIHDRQRFIDIYVQKDSKQRRCKEQILCHFSIRLPLHIKEIVAPLGSIHEDKLIENFRAISTPPNPFYTKYKIHVYLKSEVPSECDSNIYLSLANYIWMAL